MGILHRNILGHNITAVYFPELPVEMLVSTQGLKANHWETHFMVSGDYIQNVKTGRILSVETSANGLPTIDLKFDEMEMTKFKTPNLLFVLRATTRFRDFYLSVSAGQ